MRSAPAHIAAINVVSFGSRYAAPDVIFRGGDGHLVREQFHQSGLVGEGHDREKSRAGHDVVVVEVRGLSMEGAGRSHWKCPVGLIRSVE